MARRFAVKLWIGHSVQRLKSILAPILVFWSFVFSQKHSTMPVFPIRQFAKELSGTLIFCSFGLPCIELECLLFQQHVNGKRAISR